MNCNSIEKIVGVTLLQCIITPNSRFYRGLTKDSIWDTSKVKELGQSFEIAEDGIITDLDNITFPPEMNGFLSLGNSYKREGKEYCKAFPVRIEN